MVSDERETRGTRRQAGDLIAAVVENMRQNREELRYSVVVPTRYTVLLSAAEFARLEGIIPRLQAETVRALNEELGRMNQASWIERRVGGWLPRRRRALEKADADWHVEFLTDVDGELAHAHDIVVHSELRFPGDPELGAGERTRRITTVRTGSNTTHREAAVSAPAVPLTRARLTYTDAAGTHRYDVLRDSTTIGRGGVVFPVDVRVNTSEDVSREHARIRRDPATGTFYLIDLSTLGTTINGRHVPRGFEEVQGTKRENGSESQLPARARIGLAETVFIEFEQLP
jgi:pSer/pThr/pTyr-binding forkhead associated (FHA) protein